MTAQQQELPHGGYMALEAERLEAGGIATKDWWTETPDGEQLDAVFNFDLERAPELAEEWPDGIYLAWDQRRGWALITRGENRWVIDLPLGLYAHPYAVARAALFRLFNQDYPEIDDAWDGAAAVLAKVEVWEAEGR